MKKTLYKSKSNFYTPELHKFDGYSQFPRPRGHPYTNKMNDVVELNKSEVLPKQMKAIKTYKNLMQHNNSITNKTETKIFGQMLTGSIVDQKKIEAKRQEYISLDIKKERLLTNSASSPTVKKGLTDRSTEKMNGKEMFIK